MFERLKKRLRKKISEAPKPRYSQTIPPENRGKITGTYRIDAKKRLELAKTHQRFEKMPGEKRIVWEIGGTLLKAFDTWKLLPLKITETDSSERRSMLTFISGKILDRSGGTLYGPLPSPEAINIELARLVLDEIDEWSALEPSTLFILEPEIISFINQDHREFRNIPTYEPDNMDLLLAPHAPEKKPSNHNELVEETRREVLNKIRAKIVELSQQYGTPEAASAKISKIRASVSQAASHAMLPPPYPPATEENPDQNDRPTIPSGPMAKRKSDKPQK